MKRSLEFETLTVVLKGLPTEYLEQIRKRFAGNLDRYMVFLEALEESAPDQSLDVMGDWREYARRSGERFTSLMEAYIGKYKENEKKAGRKGTLADLQETVNNHSKWHRMIRDHGMGNQYRDDMRRACFAFRLTFPEATELLWSAGQPFDPEDKRDFMLADLLRRGVYDTETVNRTLQDSRLEPIFEEN